ncbi:MAG TPA: hypothetical protein V6D17_09875 [Candidatus Obscuribacterales bacterium]
MKRRDGILLTLQAAATAALIAGAPALAQRPKVDSLYRAPQTMHGKTAVIPVGFIFEGRIDHTIGSSVSKPGERFEIEMSAPVLANGVDVLVPSGSRVLGEVVEAIPSSRLPREKGYPKPTGKLRVQISGLRTPDGVTYPLVASLAGESFASGSRRHGHGNERPNERLGQGIAYVGSQAGFEAVAPGMASRMRNTGGAPKVLTRQELMRDAIFGVDQNSRPSGSALIRSLIKRNDNLYIVAGSPLSVRIDAPFKLGIAPAPGSSALLDEPIQTQESIQASGGRRFAKSRRQEETQQAAPVQEAPKPLIPDLSPQSSNPFLPNTGSQPPASVPSMQPPPQATPATIPQTPAFQDQGGEQKAPGTDF